MVEYSIRSLKPKKRKTTMIYLSIKEKKEVILECGDSALIMYDFYISKGGARDYQFSDGKTATALGWDERKAQRIRLKLEKSKYIKTIPFRNGKKLHIVTYLGKENVTASTKENFVETQVIESEKITCTKEVVVENILDYDNPFGTEEDDD